MNFGVVRAVYTVGVEKVVVVFELVGVKTDVDEVVEVVEEEEVDEVVLVVFGGGGGVLEEDEVDEDEDVDEGLVEDDGLLLPLLPPPLPPETTYTALDPFGTVTTQKAAPPTPPVQPSHSLTWCLDGSIPHGRPLHPPPSHSTWTPQFGIVSLNGVAGSR